MVFYFWHLPSFTIKVVLLLTKIEFLIIFLPQVHIYNLSQPDSTNIFFQHIKQMECSTLNDFTKISVNKYKFCVYK